MPSVEEAKRELLDGLLSAGIELAESRREAELIIEYATGMPAAQQVLSAKLPIGETGLSTVRHILACRQKRMPLQYCLGHAYFTGLKLAVRPGVLIPRADTEILVEIAVQKLESRHHPKIVDLGVGSGAIAIAILKHLPDAHVTAIDSSAKAIEIAYENALSHQVGERMTLIHSDWQLALPEQVDAILSNPPYIPLAKQAELAPEISLYEPSEALFGEDEDGLGFYRRLSRVAGRHLNDGGFLAVEFGDGQAEAVSGIFKQSGWRQLEIHDDLNRLPRVLWAAKPKL